MQLDCLMAALETACENLLDTEMRTMDIDILESNQPTIYFGYSLPSAIGTEHQLSTVLRMGCCNERRAIAAVGESPTSPSPTSLPFHAIPASLPMF